MERVLRRVVRRVELGVPTEQPSDDGAQEPLRTWANGSEV
jgi:hypothetical protein